MQGQYTDSDYHMVQGKGVGNEKQRAATTGFWAEVCYPGINGNP